MPKPHITQERISLVKRLLSQNVSMNEINRRHHIGKVTIKKIRDGYYDSATRNQTPAAVLQNCGLTREQVQERHDIPARLRKALDGVIATFKDGMAYEEPEIRRLCRVSSSDVPYWEEITAGNQYSQFYGYSEKGVRLWGTVNEILWMEENVTGFRGGV